MLSRNSAARFFILALALTIGCFGYASMGNAASTFAVSDKQIGCKAPKWGATITGSSMVYLGEDEQRINQIYSCNLETGELKQLTTETTYKESFSAGGDYAVYLENRFDMVLLNLQTGEISKPDIKRMNYDGLRTDGKYVTYREPADRILHVYDMESKETRQIGEAMGPSIVEGNIVYSSFSENGIDILLYDTRIGTSRVLQKAATQGYGDVAFNGKSVVWTVKDGMEYQNRILRVNDEIDPLPAVLDVFSEFIPLSPIQIGQTYAAWIDRDNGKETIVASELASRQTDIVAEDGEKLIGIYLDQLVLSDKENNVFLRSLSLTGQGKPITEALVSAVPFPDQKIPDQAYGYLDGRYSSSQKPIALSDNSVILSPGEMNNEGHFSTITHSRDDLSLTKALEPGQKMVSQPWAIDIGTRADSVKLSMTYLAQRVPDGQRDKLGIYLLDSGKWTYMGGLFEQQNERIFTDINESGIYMVLYYDVPHTYIRDYWQEKLIKELNATKPIRVFLEGEELSFHEQPVLKDGSTTVEFRPIFEKLGLQIEWDSNTQTITGSKQGMSLQLAVGQPNAVVNDATFELPTSPFLNHDYTFVPLRFVGEATGLKVLWDMNLHAVYLYDPATEGKLYDKNGVLLYEGQLKDGKMNGKGKLYHEDGTLWYDAEFIDNEVNGWGTLHFAGMSRGRDRTGEISIGRFKDGLPEGHVININDNGLVQYEGQVIRGIYNGKGKYYVMDQLVYDGEFKDNLFDGYGKYFSNGELQYEGYFIQNLPNGHGKRYNSDGTVYEQGEYVDGILQGK